MKKRNGGKKSPKSARPRPFAPSDARFADRGESLEEAIRASSAESVKSPPEPPDTLAPTTSDPHLLAQQDEVRSTLPSTPPSGGTKITRDGSRPSLSRLASAGHDDDHHEFFAGEKAAVAEYHAEAHRSFAVEEEEVVKASLRIVTPAMLARQKKLRQVVTWVVGAATVMTVAVGVRMATFKKVDTDVSAAVAVVRPVEVLPPAVVKAVEAAKPAEVVKPVEEVRPAEVAKPVEEAKPAEVAKPVEDAKPAEAAKPEATPEVEKPAPTLDPEKAKALTKKALQQLETGKYPAAIESATASVDADPTDANAYLYWGTALMEQGKRADAKKIFALCVEKATRGPKHECRQFKLPDAPF